MIKKIIRLAEINDKSGKGEVIREKSNIDNTTVTFTSSETRIPPASGDTMTTIMGKILKYITSLKQIAFTGSYSDLNDRPTSLPASDVHSWAKASDKPSYSWNEINGKPGSFTPSSHNHNILSIGRASGAGGMCDVYRDLQCDNDDDNNSFLEVGVINLGFTPGDYGLTFDFYKRFAFDTGNYVQPYFGFPVKIQMNFKHNNQEGKLEFLRCMDLNLLYRKVYEPDVIASVKHYANGSAAFFVKRTNTREFRMYAAHNSYWDGWIVNNIASGVDMRISWTETPVLYLGNPTTDSSCKVLMKKYVATP